MTGSAAAAGRLQPGQRVSTPRGPGVVSALWEPIPGQLERSAPTWVAVLLDGCKQPAFFLPHDLKGEPPSC